MTKYNGKVIYTPSVKAGEYSEWAANFYVGCSNGCDYCYLKKGRGAKVLGGNVPTLKKSLQNKYLALYYFDKEVKCNLEELQKNGLFFSFTTDPLLPETVELTIEAVRICQYYKVPVSILSKHCEKGLKRFVDVCDIERWDKSKIQIGFTLTGFDDREPNASTHVRRITSIKELKLFGFKTFASIEPILDFNISFNMIVNSILYCEVFKISLESGKKYSNNEVIEFVDRINGWIKNDMFFYKTSTKIYWKDSLLKYAGIDRSELPDFCVPSNYKFFEDGTI